MATETATIRVPRAVRDSLAAEATAHGLSLASFLSQLAAERALERVWQSEREATEQDSRSPAVRTEDEMWGSGLTDGFS